MHCVHYNGIINRSACVAALRVVVVFVAVIIIVVAWLLVFSQVSAVIL